jgi:hypothetical protein
MSGIKCCKGCVPPKRYTGCHQYCEEYIEQKVELEKERKAEKEWKETKKKAEVKEFLKLINNDYFYSIIPSTKMYDTL